MFRVQRSEFVVKAAVYYQFDATKSSFHNSLLHGGKNKACFYYFLLSAWLGYLLWGYHISCQPKQQASLTQYIHKFKLFFSFVIKVLLNSHQPTCCA